MVLPWRQRTGGQGGAPADLERRCWWPALRIVPDRFRGSKLGFFTMDGQKMEKQLLKSTKNGENMRTYY